MIKKHLTILTCLVALALSLALSSLAWSKGDPFYTGWRNVAVGGYDVVTYFAEKGPVKGSSKFSTKYMEAKWHFANQKNLDLFVSNPTKYQPQYGGYCAWAVAKGSTASAEPLQWTIHKNKLYLNYNAAVNKIWRKNKVENIRRGDKNWPGVLE